MKEKQKYKQNLSSLINKYEYLTDRRYIQCGWNTTHFEILKFH